MINCLSIDYAAANCMAILLCLLSTKSYLFNVWKAITAETVIFFNAKCVKSTQFEIIPIKLKICIEIPFVVKKTNKRVFFFEIGLPFCTIF